MKKRLLALALASLCTLSFAQGKDLKVAIDPTYEPFTFKTPDGKPTGFDVDIARALCEQIKRKCVFVEQVWDSMIPGLQAKKYDVIISSLSITADRLKAIDFTDKYYNTPSRIVLKKEVSYSGPASIKGKKIGVLKGSTQEKYAMGELKPAGVTVIPYEAQDQVYLDIKAGRLDGTVADFVEVTGGFLSKPEGRDYVLARLFANEGCSVVLAARRVDRLNAIAGEIRAAGGQASVVALDVADPAQVEKAVKTILDKFGHIDILFNNAGFGRLDWLEKLDPQKHIQYQIAVNLTGLIHLTRLILPSMLARRSGTILNMSSVAGWIAPPLYSIYSATKHGVRGFTDALRREVAPFGIKVCGIYPGGATTEFGTHTGSAPSKKIFKKAAFLNMSSEYVARRTVGLARHPRRTLFLPWWYRPVVWFESLFPGLVDWILKVLFVQRLHIYD